MGKQHLEVLTSCEPGGSPQGWARPATGRFRHRRTRPAPGGPQLENSPRSPGGSQTSKACLCTRECTCPQMAPKLISRSRAHARGASRMLLCSCCPLRSRPVPPGRASRCLPPPPRALGPPAAPPVRPRLPCCPPHTPGPLLPPARTPGPLLTPPRAPGLLPPTRPGPLRSPPHTPGPPLPPVRTPGPPLTPPRILGPPAAPPARPGPPAACAGVLPQAAPGGPSHTPPLEGLVLTGQGDPEQDNTVTSHSQGWARQPAPSPQPRSLSSLGP